MAGDTDRCAGNWRCGLPKKGNGLICQLDRGLIKDGDGVWSTRLVVVSNPGESDVVDQVLVELDKQETFIRQLARRIDRGDTEHPLIELEVSERMHAAFEYIHRDEDATRENPPLPDPVFVVLARAKGQAIAIERLAERIVALGGSVEVESIKRRLERAREGMGHRLEELLTDNPKITRTWIAKDFHEVVYNPQQDILFKLDDVLRDVEHASET